MCGHFSQSMTREDYLSCLADEADRDIAYDPEPIGRYNVAPGTKVLLLSERDRTWHRKCPAYRRPPARTSPVQPASGQKPSVLR